MWYWITFLLIVIAVIYSIHNKSSQISYSRSNKLDKQFVYNRNNIWKKCYQMYGLSETLKIMPMTYCLPNDYAMFYADWQPNKEYIAKELESGQRRGVYLVNKTNINEILKSHNISQIQEYIPNPLTVKGHKFGMRFFMVVDCMKGIFLYRDGYNVFADKPFYYKGLDKASKINQSLGGDEFYDQIDVPRLSSEIPGICHIALVNELGDKLAMIASACDKPCGDKHRGSARIYGVDAELLDDKSIRIIEINSSPSTRFDIKWKNVITREVRKCRMSGHYSDDKWIKISEN
jgi:hypothetical protein